MKRLILSFPLLVVTMCCPALAQDYNAQFKQLFDKQDFPAQEKLLKKWESASPNDPELYVAYINHYFALGQTMSLTTAQPNGKSVKLTKSDDDKVVAYLGDGFDMSSINKGLTYIDRGIEKFPDRLDMRFGKTYVLGQIREFQKFADEIMRTVQRSEANKNAWLWREGKPLENSDEFMLKGIQDYLVQLFDAGDEETKLIRPIAEAILRTHPNHVESLSNLAVTYIIANEFAKAIPSLTKAEKIAPADGIVVGNLAYCYFSLHDKQNAPAYYEKLKKVGNDQQRRESDTKIAEINKWK